MEPPRAGPSKASARNPFDDARRRQAVARLRERYGEAHGLVSREQPHAHLEWILGKRRDLDRDDAALETSVSELVVLWLQDLAVELDSGVAPRIAADTDESPLASSASRQDVAERLRIATREFASAFLSQS